ncbi:MAG: prolyl oligopeptidase family serine peptidase [Acidobacteriota bacterium]|nr:MAG: prolyl oligopeptidase family serine peptidase [Acidobacteriota bacterium]
MYKKIFPALFLPFFLAVQALAQADPLLISRTIYEFPSWEKASESTDVEKFYAIESEYRKAVSDKRFRFEKIRYRSDGLSVVAYIYGPKGEKAWNRPVIVFNRGSYIRGDIAPEHIAMFNRLADAGFTIVAPLYRGSDGGEGRDELGGADLNDLMNIVPVIREIGWSDKNLFLYGESRGGMMVFQAIRDGFPARAAATFGAFTDLEEMGRGPQGEAMARAIWPDFEKKRAEIIERRSAILWPEKLKVPLLLMHGGKDQSVAVNQTLRLSSELSKSDLEFGVTVFPGADHTISGSREERDRHAVEFFRRFLVK